MQVLQKLKYTFIHIHILLYVYIYVYMYVYMHVYMCIYMYVYLMELKAPFSITLCKLQELLPAITFQPQISKVL